MVFNGPKLLVDAAQSSSSAFDCKVKWLDENVLAAQLQKVAAASEESSTTLLVYLGKDVEMSMSYWALDIASSPLLQSLYNEHEQMFTDPRPTVFSLSSFEAGVFALASSVLDFNRRIKFCSGCGSKTMMGDAGWKRICSNQECVSHKRTENYSYIRTDAVVIVNVESADGESILLGRQKSWPPNRYSCIAGFLEPGESLAQAAVREVLEETGVRLDTQSISFSSSQPWPFPSQLMLGMHARAAEGKGSVIDISSRDLELEDAKWFSRTQVLEALAADGGTEKRSGELKLPPDYAIAHSLIKSWAVDTPSALNQNPKL